MTNEEAIKECVKIQAFGVSERQVEAMEMAIKALKQEPCGNAIDRAEAIKIASGYCHPANVAKELAKLPSVTPQPKIGHWIFVDRAHEHAHCSECDYGNVDLLDGRPHNYCPNCGAKMVEPQERSGKE